MNRKLLAGLSALGVIVSAEIARQLCIRSQGRRVQNAAIATLTQAIQNVQTVLQQRDPAVRGTKAIGDEVAVGKCRISVAVNVDKDELVLYVRYSDAATLNSLSTALGNNWPTIVTTTNRYSSATTLSSLLHDSGYFLTATLNIQDIEATASGSDGNGVIPV